MAETLTEKDKLKENESDRDCRYSKYQKGITYETVDELAQRTKLKRSWWYGQTRRNGKGAVPRIKRGKYLRFVPHEVDEWLKGRDIRF